MKHKILMLIAFATLGLTFATLAQVPNYIPTNGLVGYWPFNGNANDASGNGNNGTVNGATLTTDRFGIANKAYSTGNNMNILKQQFASNFNNLTISCWFSTSNNILTQRIIVHDWVANGGTFSSAIVNNNFGFITRDNVNNYSSVHDNSQINNNTWYNYTLTVNNTKSYLYRNAILIDSSNSIQLKHCTFDLYFGGDNTWPFYGKIDDIGIWNRALTQQEITGLYLSSQPCPNIATIQGPNNVSIGNTITLTDSTANGTWSSSNTTVATINPSGVVTGHTVGTTIISYIATTSCGLDTATYAITVNANPCLPNYIPTNGLVGYWPFCGNANDESGNGNHGTVNGATLTSDRFGNINKAYSFDGTTSYIQCQNAGPTGNPVITFTCWVKTASTNYGNIISYGGNSQSGQDFRVFINGNCPNSFAFDTYDNQKAKVSTFNNSWDFYCVLYDGGIGNNTTVASFYKNGILMTTECFNVNISSTNISNLIPITFGKYHGTLPANPTGFYDGVLDDIGIWNRALTQQEITALYLSGQPCPSIATIQGPNNVNIGNTITLTDSTVNGTWSSSNTTVASINSSGVVTGHTVGTTIISYIATTPCGLDTATYAITVNANPCLPNYIPTNGLVGYWPFCGNANDESGNGNNGTVYGASLTVDRNGNANSAYSFDGVTNKIIVSNSSGFNFQSNNSFSVSYWLKLTTFSGTVNIAFDKQSSLGNSQVGWNSFIEPNNYTNFYLHNGFGGLNACNYGLIQVSQWFHIVQTWGNNIANVYLNGQLIGSTQYTDVVGDNLENLIIGNSDFTPPGTGINGLMDDIGIWNRALTPQEITALYTSSCTFSSNHFAQDTIAACGSSYALSAGAGFSNYIWSTGDTTQSIAVNNSGWHACTVTNSAGCTASDSVYVSLMNANILQNDTSVCAGNTLLLAASTVSTSSLSSSVLPTNLQQGLVGYWPFNGNANDESGNGNNGTVNGATLTSDRFGNTNKAYSFDGVNCCGTPDPISEIAINNNFIDIHSDFTISCWMKSDNISKYQQCLFNSIGHTGFAVELNNEHVPNKLTFGVGPANAFWDLLYAPGSTSNFQNNTWYPVTFIKTGVIYSMYLNGNLEYSTTVPNSINYNQLVGLRIGSIGYGHENFEGSLDDYMFWNRALSSSEITQITNINSSPLNTYLWSTGDTTATINVNPTQTTTYYCTVSNGTSSCTDSVTVTVNPLPTNIFAQDTIVACGSSYTLSAGTGYSNYNWSTGDTTSSISVSNSGWYQCTVSNSAGCTGSDSVYVSLVNANILQNDTSICTGSPFQLAATGSGAIVNAPQLVDQFTMTFGGPFNHTLNTVAGETYSMSISGVFAYHCDAFGQCDAGFAFNQPNIANHQFTVWNGVQIRPTPDLYNSSHVYNYTNLVATQNLQSFNFVDNPYWDNCGSLDFSIYKNASTLNYLWSTGDTTATINVNPTQTTTYYCTVSNGISSCVDSVTVTINPLPTNIFAQDTLAACGSSYTLSAGAGYSNYNWSTGDTISSITVNNSGWYKCTVSNSAGCTASDSVYVSLLNANILQNDTTICVGSALTFTNQSNSLLNDTVLVEQFTLNVMQAFNYTTSNLLSNTTYLVKVAGTAGFAGGVNSQDAAYQYNWFGSPVTPWPFPNATSVWWYVNGSNILRPVPNLYNPSHIYYFPFQGNGQSLNFSFTDNPYSDNSGSLDFEIYKLSSAYYYLWSTGDTTATINVNPTQTTTYYCTVSNGITSCTDSVTVTVNPLPTNLFAQDTLAACASSYTLSAGAGYSNYNWNTGDTTSSIVVNNSGWYQCTVTNSAGCTISDSIYLAINALPTVTANASATTVCAGNSVTLTGVGASTYTWSGGITNGVSFVPTATTTYTVTGTDINGCSNTAIQTITVNPLPTVTANASATSVCAGTSVTLTGGGATNYTWSGGVTNGVSFVPTTTTTYTVTGTDVNGCTNTATKTITVNALPILAISASKQLYCEKDTVGILTGNPIGGVWSGVGVSGNTFNPTVAGLGSFYAVYTFTATNGCTNKDSLLMKVTSCLGVDDVSDENLFSVYPNPTTSEINVKTDVQLIGSDFVLYDNAGNVLRRGKIKSENTLIKLSDYSAGVYYFTVVNPLYGKHSIKVIKE